MPTGNDSTVPFISMSELIKHTPKLWERKLAKGSYWCFYCPGCKRMHLYDVGTEYQHQWQFNGDVNNPTFTPSLRLVSDIQGCHLNITNGQIQFHGDCWHDLKGQTVPMVDIPDTQEVR